MANINTKLNRGILLILLSVITAPIMESSVVSGGENHSNAYVVEAKSQTVYYCTGPNAKKYHSTSRCRGLRKCSCRIVKCSKSEAQNKGFRPCKICY